MELEALKQLLVSLGINPDEIKDEIYAKAFRILFFSLKNRMRKLNSFRKEPDTLR